MPLQPIIRRDVFNEIQVHTIKEKVSGNGITVDNALKTNQSIEIASNDGTLRSGAIIQVVSSAPIGGTTVSSIAAYANNKANFKQIGTGEFDTEITIIQNNSKLLVSGNINYGHSNTSHRYFDLKVIKNGSTLGWLSELWSGATTGNYAIDGILTCHTSSTAYQYMEAFKLLYTPSTNLIAGDVLVFQPFVGAWSAGTMHINAYVTTTNYNQIAYSSVIVEEVSG